MTIGAPGLELSGLSCRLEIAFGGSRATELRAAMERAWTRCLTGLPDPADAGGLRVELHAEGERGSHGEGVVSGTDLARVLQNTTQSVTHAFVRAQAGSLLMLHGGACSDPVTGATVGFVAPGGTGKTTLARRLGRRLGYVTDETVGIRPDGSVVPYPKPLSIRPASGTGPKIETSPDELGLLPAPDSPRLTRLVLLRRDPSHPGPSRLTPLNMSEAIVELAPESSSLSSLPRPLHLLAELLQCTGPVLRCDYAEADELAPRLLEVLG